MAWGHWRRIIEVERLGGLNIYRGLYHSHVKIWAYYVFDLIPVSLKFCEFSIILIERKGS